MSNGDTLRPNELTGIVGRDIFERPPADIDNDADLRRWTEFRAAYHRASRLENVAPFPLQLDLELNSDCNLRCTFCQQTQSPRPVRWMTWDTFERVVAEGEQNGLVSMKLNVNNEPLVRRDFVQFVRYAKQHGVLNTYIATNGLGLTEMVARELIAARLTKLMVSLDASTAATYRAMRNSDQFERIVANVHRLIDLRDRLGSPLPLVRVNFLKTRLNIHEAEQFRAEWEDVADAVGFQEQLGIPGVTNDFDVDHRGVDGVFRCAMPFKIIAVSTEGELWPCCTFSGLKMPLGNLRDTTITAAWRGREKRWLRTLHERGRWADFEVCSHCVGAEKPTQTN